MLNLLRPVSLAAAVALSFIAVDASAATFTFDSNGGNGTGVDNGPTGAYDFAVTLVSNNNGTAGIYTTADATATDSMWVTGLWQYSTNDVDGSSFDPFGYYIDTTFVQLTATSAPPSFQNGSFSFFVSGGQDWGFYSYSTDGILGSSTAISYGDLAPVPLPAGGLLLLGALGGVAALRRRKATAA